MPDTPSNLNLDDQNQCIIVLPTTHHTLLAEEMLQSVNIRYLPIPKPRTAASDCGMAIQIECKDLGAAATTLRKMDVKFYAKTADGKIKPIKSEASQEGEQT